MRSKYYLFFCAISISFVHVSAQSCPPRIFGEVSIIAIIVAESIKSRYYVLLDTITDGVDAELICSDSDFLLGIRVSWSWISSDPVECFNSAEVDLISISNTVVQIHKTIDSTSRNNSVEFDGTELDCNTRYLSRVSTTPNDARLYDYGNDIFFGGTLCTIIIM